MTQPRSLTDAELRRWIDKLEIRELLERYMRHNDDRAADKLVELLDEGVRFQVMGRVYVGRDAVRELIASGPGDPPHWTEPGALLRQPGSTHVASNPVIEVDGDAATAETDFVVLRRDSDGRATVRLLGRYRDRLRRRDDGQWVITTRTAVSVARPGEEGSDAEWQRALRRLGAQARAESSSP
ncbi:MAG TPA: nuclear transport factor 2 family protein [Acidimicrobiales bacterium]|nr:nuclear transport factor 2 family protein [Acidimicrobiales bacterium]